MAMTAPMRTLALPTFTRRAVATLYAGLALTVATTVVPYIDRAALSHHIRAGYPHISQAKVDSGATFYLIYLSVIGVIGTACWLWMAWAVKKQKRWARPTATAVFLLGGALALMNLMIKDTSGETGLPALLGWTGLLPSLAGLAAVVLLWKSDRVAAPGA